MDGDLDTTILGQTTGPDITPDPSPLAFGLIGLDPAPPIFLATVLLRAGSLRYPCFTALLAISAHGLNALGFELAQCAARRRGATKALMEPLDAFDRRRGAVKIEPNES